jgi:hypothetical protein
VLPDQGGAVPAVPDAIRYGHWAAQAVHVGVPFGQCGKPPEIIGQTKPEIRRSRRRQTFQGHGRQLELVAIRSGHGTVGVEARVEIRDPCEMQVKQLGRGHLRYDLLRLVICEMVLAPELRRFLSYQTQRLRFSGLTAKYGLLRRAFGPLHRHIVP